LLIYRCNIVLDQQYHTCGLQEEIRKHSSTIIKIAFFLISPLRFVHNVLKHSEVANADRIKKIFTVRKVKRTIFLIVLLLTFLGSQIIVNIKYSVSERLRTF
jgi:hypothetical protein